ncbi:MAG: hypothetical protein KUG57_11840, partial [Ilumatobacteraceae bacterium]|nr:hypothetical protein [Ilumatobacteraceae bacterium]
MSSFDHQRMKEWAMGQDEPTSDEVWANTNPASPPPSESGPEQPSTPPIDDPTSVLPVTDPSTPAGGSGGASPGGPGAPPPRGGPPQDGSSGERPPWLLPVAAGLVGSLVVGLTLLVVLSDDDNNDTSDKASETTLPDTNSPAATATPTSTTTSEPVPSSSTEATQSTTLTASTVEVQPATTLSTTTTTTSPAATSTTSTTVSEDLPPPTEPDPGTAVIDGSVYPLEASCLSVPLQPDSADLRVASYLVDASFGRLVFDRWEDNGFADGLDATDIDSGEAFDVSDLLGSGLSGPFSASLSWPDDLSATFDVAFGPPRGGPIDCLDTLQTRDADSDPASRYTRAILDVCTTVPGPGLLDVTGVASESALFNILD